MSEIRQYSVLENVNLRDDCSGYQRTEVCSVINLTNAKITLCVFQVTSRYTVLPDPYIFDTGVFVGGVNLPAGANVAADPCKAGGFNQPIAGTYGTCSFEYSHPDLGTGTLNPDPYEEAEEGNFYPALIWELRLVQRVLPGKDSGKPQLVARRINTGLRQFHGR